MIGYPLDSKVEYDSEGKPTYDRAITSKPLRKLYSQLFSTGVMPNPSNNFQVIAGDAGMTVKVNPGFAVVQGCLKLEETTRTIEIQAASSSLDRIDTVVLRLNDEVNARICDLYVRQGIPASSPTRPDLVRSGSVYEIGLADIFIPANTATIVQKRITDTRLDPDRCGYVSSISKFDTETLYLQIQNDLADFKLNEQADFLEWFEYIKGQLSEDVAGNLQNQIGVLSNLKTEIKTDLVNAINWLKENVDTLNSNLSTIYTIDTAKIETQNGNGAIDVYKVGHLCTVSLEWTPTQAIANYLIVAIGLPKPKNKLYFTLPTTDGNGYSAMLTEAGEIKIYYSNYSTISRVDHTFTYITID